MELVNENPQENPSGQANESASTNALAFPITFHGSYSQYLGLSLYNFLLTILTFGLYYPWAKCAIRKFMWQETEIDGSRFEWHGTGPEMFRGFIKAYLVLGGLFFLINFSQFFLPPQYVIWVVLVCYLIILCLLPLVVHGVMRYRLSRTSLRSIQFGYRGQLGDFYKKTAVDFLLTLLTFGIYGSWLAVNMRKYILKHSRFGNVEGKFNAEGGDLFWLSLGHGILTIITLYLYLPWYIVRLFRFYIENMVVVQEGKEYRFKSNAKGHIYFWTLIKAAFITVVTLGICGPIASLMLKKFWLESISLEKGFDFNAVQQTERAYTDATGDDMADLLDLDL